MRTKNEIAQDIRDLEKIATSDRSDSLEYYYHKLTELFAELEASNSFDCDHDISGVMS